MSLLIRFENKGLAQLVTTDGDQATLICDFSSPPGSPLSGVILESENQVQLKVRACRRSPAEPSRYELRGRWVGLSRATRGELLGSRADNQDP
jgi:hypothetical protein